MTCNQTAVAVLQELCMKRKWNPPIYDWSDVSGPSNDPIFEVTVTCQNNITGKGRGRTKKAAKHDAAQKALLKLEANALTDGQGPQKAAKDNTPINPHDEDVGGLNPVGELQNLCLTKKLPAPEYILVGDEGEPHEKTFTMKCVVSKRSVTGTARKKQNAKHISAQKMLEVLKSDMKAILDEIPDDPAVSSMYSQKSKERFVPEAEIKDDIEVAEKYKSLREKFSNIPLINPGTKFSDYHLAYALQLQSYKDIAEQPKIKTEKLYLKKLEMVCQEMHFNISVTQCFGNNRAIIVFIQIDADPPIIQAGLSATSMEDATEKAARETIQFLDTMCRI